MLQEILSRKNGIAGLVMMVAGAAALIYMMANRAVFASLPAFAGLLPGIVMIIGSRFLINVINSVHAEEAAAKKGKKK